MSTRCVITVRDRKDGNEKYSIYRHSDGYPDTEHGVLATLPQALTYAWPLPRYEAMDFAAAIVAAWKRPAQAEPYRSQGGGIYLTEGRDAHGDLEFSYEVYPDGNGRVIVETFAATYPNGYAAAPAWKPRGLPRVLTAKHQPPLVAA